MKHQEEDKTETPQIKPNKFKSKNWEIWAKQFDLYLSNHKGAQFFPLDYVIRSDISVGYTHTTTREAGLYCCLLTRVHYQDDNMQLFLYA